MKAEIIAIGTELLMGQIANTNAQYLSQKLNELGIDVYYHHVVGDNRTRIKELLKGRTPEDALKALKSTRTKVSSKRESILSKIEERSRDLKTVSPTHIEAVKRSMASTEDAIASAKAKLVSGSAIEGIDELNKAYAEAEKKKTDALMAYKEKLRDKRAALLKERYEIEAMQKGNAEIDKDAERLTRNIAKITEQKAKLLTEYHRLKKLTMDDEGFCPTCGQEVPEWFQAKAREKFNAEKAAAIKANIEEGKDLALKIRDLERSIALSEEGRLSTPSELEQRHETIVVKIRSCSDKLDADVSALMKRRDLPKEIQDLEASRWLAKQAIEKAMKKGELKEEARLALEEKIARYREELAKDQATISAYNQSTASRERIAELQEEAKATEAQYSSLCEDIHTIEQAIKAMLENTTEAINGLFRSISFRLFEPQINGGYKEICEPTIEGVPFGSANNGAKVHAGVEIATRLQEYYDKKLPIWIDNAESVVGTPESEAQIVLLKVNENQKRIVAHN